MGGTGAEECDGGDKVQRGLRLGPSPAPNFSMGNNLIPACKLFDQMPARKIFLNFAILFGGLYSYLK